MPLRAGLLLPWSTAAKQPNRAAIALDSRRYAYEPQQAVDRLTQLPRQLQKLFSAEASGQPAERQCLKERVTEALQHEGVSQLWGSAISPTQLRQLASQIVLLRCIRRRLAMLQCLEAVPEWTEELAADAESYGPLALLHLPAADYQPIQEQEQRGRKRRRTRLYRRRSTTLPPPEAEWSTDTEDPIDVGILPRGSPEAEPITRKVKLPPLKRRRLARHKEIVSPVRRLSTDADTAAAHRQEQNLPSPAWDNIGGGVPGSKVPSPAPKRKPGRPRKGTEPETPKQLRKLDFRPPIVKGVQKRGRPTKPGEAVAHAECPAVASASQQKRKRGRPRKHPEPAAESPCAQPAPPGPVFQKANPGRKAEAAASQLAADAARAVSSSRQQTLSSPTKPREQPRRSLVTHSKPSKRSVGKKQEREQSQQKTPAQQLEQVLQTSKSPAEQQTGSGAETQPGRAVADMADKAAVRRKNTALELQKEADRDMGRLADLAQQNVAASAEDKAVSKQRARAQAQPEDCVYDADASDSGEDDATELLGDEGSGLGGPPETENREAGVQLCRLGPLLLPPVTDEENFCSVCGDEDGSNSENEVLLCEARNCRVAAHQQCYGVPRLPTGKWLCDGCSASISPVASACVLCPCSGGALRRVTSLGPVQPPKGLSAALNASSAAVPKSSRQGKPGSKPANGGSKQMGDKGLPPLRPAPGQGHPFPPASSNAMQQAYTAAAGQAPRRRKTASKSSPTGLWVHSACVLWSREATFGDPESLDDVKLDGLTLGSINLSCSFCHQGGGSAVQCSAPECSTSFHPICGGSEGCVLPISKSANTLAFCRLHSRVEYVSLREGLVADDSMD